MRTKVWRVAILLIGNRSLTPVTTGVSERLPSIRPGDNG